MIFERTMIYSLYNPYSMYFRMAVCINLDMDIDFHMASNIN